mmetsp:Transcript_5464/g.9631  ORF Transcript_5464/g.9631 Transcript_5464/m.9631 type:complete len:192 (-) Transcript_5464:884-1459(-)
MELSSSDEQIELSQIMFIDKFWLSYYPLTHQTALEYFSRSPFYSKSSNNEILKKQNLNPSLLLQMTGLEYTLIPPPQNQQQQQLFIVQEQIRESEVSTKQLHRYYILNGSIFQDPSILSVVSTRVLHAVSHSHRAFDDIMQSISQSNLSTQSTHQSQIPVESHFESYKLSQTKIASLFDAIHHKSISMPHQ